MRSEQKFAEKIKMVAPGVGAHSDEVVWNGVGQILHLRRTQF